VAESLLLSAIAARRQLRLGDGARVHPAVSSTLVPNGHPVPVTRPRVTGAFTGQSSVIPPCSRSRLPFWP
jgi:hypothetical protein